MRLVIGLIGEMGAGKETFARIVANIAKPLTIKHLGTGELLRETLEAWSLPLSRENLQGLAIAMDARFGAGTLARAQTKKIRETTEDIVIYDSVRWSHDVEVIKSFPHVLVYITAYPELRWLRLKQRGQKAGENVMSFEQFKQLENQLTETEVKSLGAGADVVVFNNGTLDQFNFLIRRQLDQYLVPFIRNKNSGK